MSNTSRKNAQIRGQLTKYQKPSKLNFHACEDEVSATAEPCIISNLANVAEGIPSYQ